MALILKLQFQKPGYPMMIKSIEIPIKFRDNPDIVNLVDNGYYYTRAEVRQVR